MKKRSFFLGAIVASIVTIMFSASCASNKKDVLYACDSTNVSYSTSIKPILVNNCYRCHSNSNAVSLGGGTALENYSDVWNYVDTTTGNDGGTLLNDIKYIGNPMPKSASKLSNCEISKIENWIKEGAKDN